MSEQRKTKKRTYLFHRRPDATPLSIRGIILTTFTVVAVGSVLLTSFVLYQQFEKHSRKMITDSTERLTEQAAMSKIVDTTVNYFTVTKENLYSTENQKMIFPIVG